MTGEIIDLGVDTVNTEAYYPLTMTTTETETTYGNMTDEQHAAFRVWLLANDYAEFPDRFGYNNGCREHPRQGKIYHYRTGGYYRCFQCVVAEYVATLA